MSASTPAAEIITWRAAGDVGFPCSRSVNSIRWKDPRADNSCLIVGGVFGVCSDTLAFVCSGGFTLAVTTHAPTAVYENCAANL